VIHGTLDPIPELSELIELKELEKELHSVPNQRPTRSFYPLKHLSQEN